MSAASVSGEPPVYDVVGVGFGPSNLALAIAVAESNAAAGGRKPVTAHFLERQQSFGWHKGMLIEDATMQVSFLKDLVTLRNPTSEFSFLNYLHAKDRLVEFINHKTLFPLRAEFHDYFEWCAARVDDQVSYGHEVLRVDPVVTDGVVDHFDVVAHNGDMAAEPVTLRARNIVLATGLAASLPEGVVAGERVWHNSQLLHRIDTVPADAQRFVVVGAGQSAAETTAMLHERFRDAEICSVFSRFGYSPSDDSPFANQIFDPGAVDAYFDAPGALKQRLLDYHANTNYAVVDLELIEDLYRRSYTERVHGEERLRWFRTTRVADVDARADGVKVTLEPLAGGAATVLDADAIVYATGYRASDPLVLLGETGRRCHRDQLGQLAIDRDYRIETDTDVTAGIYLQGADAEHTHGITASLLSNNATRSAEILQSVRQRLPEPTRQDPVLAGHKV